MSLHSCWFSLFAVSFVTDEGDTELYIRHLCVMFPIRPSEVTRVEGPRVCVSVSDKHLCVSELRLSHTHTLKTSQ